MTLLVQIALWLVRKCGVALLVAFVVLAAGATYLYVRENLRTEAERESVLAELRASAAALEAEAAAVGAKLAEVEAEVEKQKNRAEIARRLLASYEQMNSFWDWLFGASVDEKKLADQKKEADERRVQAARRLEALAGEAATLVTSRDALGEKLQEIRFEIARSELHASPVIGYLRRAWLTYRWPLVAALLAYFFGPTLWKLAAFYGLAPLVGRARAIRFTKAELPEVEVLPSRVSEAVELAPGESLFVRERFLQASDEALRRQTRFVLDWSIPFTCAACGLVELVELTNGSEEEAAVVTVSTQEDTMVELGVVRIPAGASLVLRPSFLAALALPPATRLRIRRHWRLFSLQAWVTLQFRFFEFHGPCRLVVAGSRGIRAESLAGGFRLGPRGRRTNQDATIGFTPDLAYRSVRAETFWSYYRDRNPLFDDLFQGRGTFLCQEVPTDAPGARVRRFWEAFWNGLLKVFGL